ncbi:MAG: YqeG family HAD IIIA-type phosphatase [Pygmaiobacter sp.]
MSLFYPTELFTTVSTITPQYLAAHHITALILDVDNTLTAHGSQELSPEVEQWLHTLKAAGIALIIASNNFKSRVQPFAQRIDLDFVSFSLKPLPRGLAAACRRLGVPKKNIALVGDQIFTDVLGANLYGIAVLMVRPREADTQWNIRLKRKLEEPILRRYFSRGGRDPLIK